MKFRFMCLEHDRDLNEQFEEEEGLARALWRNADRTYQFDFSELQCPMAFTNDCAGRWAVVLDPAE